MSSGDEAMSNNKSIAFFIIDNNLYYWMNGMWEGELDSFNPQLNEEIDENNYEEAQKNVLN